MIDFPLIDPDASPAENVETVLYYREEVAREDAFERAQAERTCERHRRRIHTGHPPYGVLRAVERGVAPEWVTDTLQRRFVRTARIGEISSLAG